MAAADFATPKGQGRNPYNPSILSDGSVDPKSSSYQRSVAGRQKLKPYLQGLWDKGMDEKDVFMAGVKALTSRSKGYVGAYLDSKNPGRTYTDNQAKAITDKVMTEAGIGSHPGARLTKSTGEDKDKRKEDRAQRRAASKYGPQMEPGKGAKSVRQQRKEGKREAVGMPETWAPEGTGGMGAASPVEKPAKEPTPEKGGKVEPSAWQNVLRDRMEGKASTADVVEAFRKENQSKLPKAPGGAAAPAPGKPAGAGAAKPAEPEEDEQDLEPEEEIKSPISASVLGDTFKSKLKQDMKTTGFRTGNELSYITHLSKNDPDGLIQLLADSANELEQSGKYTREGDMQTLADQINTRFARYLGGFRFEADDFGKPPEAEAQPQPKAEAQPQPQPQPQPEAQPQPQPQPEAEAEPEKLPAPGKLVADTFRRKYNETKKQLQERELAASRKERRVANRNVQVSPDDLDYLLTETVDDLSGEYDIDYETAKGIVSRQFGVSFPSQEEQPRPEAEPNPWDQPYTGPVKEIGKATPGREKAPAALPPARSPRPVTSKGGLKAPASPRGAKTAKGFTPGAGKEVVRKAAEASTTPQEFKDQLMEQLGLFGGRGFETGSAQTNPLEGGSTPTPTEEAPGEAAPRESPGQQSMFRKGTKSEPYPVRTGKGFGSNRYAGAKPAPAPEAAPAPAPEAAPIPEAAPKGREVQRQLPLNLGRENTQAKLAARRGIEERRLAKEAKKLPKPPKARKGRAAKPPVQGELFSTAEYREFADSIRAMMR